MFANSARPTKYQMIVKQSEIQEGPQKLRNTVLVAQALLPAGFLQRAARENPAVETIPNYCGRL
jgi:hypothetical protein